MSSNSSTIDYEDVNVDTDNDSENNIDVDDDIENEDSVPEITELTLTQREKYMYNQINKYYKVLDKKKIELMIEIINCKSKISLRLLDWFVTKYADKYNTKYNRINEDETEKTGFDSKIESNFNVHISYKAQLKSYKKKYFDPFRREKEPDKRKKFKYYFDKEKTLSLCTTLGQLNFFKWSFSNGVITYVNNNYNTINKAMTISNKFEKSKKNKDKEDKNKKENMSDKKSEEVVNIKKHGININAKKNISNGETKIILSFD